LKQITVPTLVMHGEDDQVVPFANAGPLSATLVKGALLKAYPGLPHGMPTTDADQINADLAFIKSRYRRVGPLGSTCPYHFIRLRREGFLR
jgi:non-heme chloroperoxidase